MVSRVICFLLVVAVANAATWMGRLPHKPKEFSHKEGCYVKEVNDVIPFGESISPVGVCYRIECSRDMLYYASCGVIAVEGAGCYKTEVDLSRPYPDCCATIQCDDIDNNLI